jgi:hypothetical protein
LIRLPPQGWTINHACREEDCRITWEGWIAAGTLEQADVEDGLNGAAERNGLVADDGERQCWATIRSGLSAGLQDPRRTAA